MSEPIIDNGDDPVVIPRTLIANNISVGNANRGFTQRPRSQLAKELQTFKTEEEMRAAIVPMAKLLGYLHYHTHRSKHSPAGFPDDVFLRPARRMGGGPRLVVAELKVHPETQVRGRPTPAQEEWLDAFEVFGAGIKALAPGSEWWPRVEACVWRPPDWFDGTIERVLRG